MSTRKNASDKLDLTSPEAISRFREAARVFTNRATKSPEVARKLLVDEGIYTKSGKLAKLYS